MMRRTIVTVNGATAENGDITGMDVIVVSNAPFKIPMHEKANPIMASREYLRARTKLIKSNSWEASKTNNQQVLGREIRNIVLQCYSDREYNAQFSWHGKCSVKFFCVRKIRDKSQKKL